tara:strand:+ start:2353 stop:3672 length:1320 start_codon:yes stop_codon:yes gene_type:complete
VINTKRPYFISMKKKCPDGKYYCYTDKVCKDIPRGFKVVGPAGMLRKENGHSVDDDSETKNGKKNGNGNGNGGAVSEDLRKWFGSGPKGGKGGGGWDRYNTKGERIGKCAREPGEGKPKCLSNEKAAKMSKAERAAAVRRKRREDPVADRPGKGGKPIMSSNKIKESSSPMVRQILEKIECEREWLLVEKNVPTNPSLWSKFKAQAKAKFDVYPSAYANGWAAKKYKAAGGSWKKATSESVQHKLEEKKGCAHNHAGEECPIHGEKECPTAKKIEEAVRVPAKTGNLYLVSFTWKGKYMMMKIFFPEVSRPTRTEVQDALEKVYPGCKVSRFDMTPYEPGEPMLSMGEEVEEVENVGEAAAWTKKSGKNKEGGLNEKGRKSYERENPGSDLKAPSKKVGNPRRKSFCARMKGMKSKLTSAKTANDPNSRINKSLRAWNC